MVSAVSGMIPAQFCDLNLIDRKASLQAGGIEVPCHRSRLALKPTSVRDALVADSVVGERRLGEPLRTFRDGNVAAAARGPRFTGGPGCRVRVRKARQHTLGDSAPGVRGWGRVAEDWGWERLRSRTRAMGTHAQGTEDGVRASRLRCVGQRSYESTMKLGRLGYPAGPRWASSVSLSYRMLTRGSPLIGINANHLVAQGAEFLRERICAARPTWMLAQVVSRAASELTAGA